MKNMTTKDIEDIRERQELENLREKVNSVPLINHQEIKNETPWIVSAPFEFSKKQWQELEEIGQEIKDFLNKCWENRNLLEQEMKDSISEENRKKIDKIENAFSQVFPPPIIRPDLVIDQAGNFRISEIEASAGGFGIMKLYQKIFGQSPDIAEIWAEKLPQKIILSTLKQRPFEPEQKYFAEKVNQFAGEERIRHLPVEDWGTLNASEAIIYNTCCTSNVLNKEYPKFSPKPKIAPPFVFDWKGLLAIAIKKACFKKLALVKRIPETHTLPLVRNEKTERFSNMSRKTRKNWIVKPVDSWGANGFRDGSNFNTEQWNKLIFCQPEDNSPKMLLQEKIRSALYEKTGINPKGELVKIDKLRIRVSPFYICSGKTSIEEITLAGVLITLRKSVIVHGATDAIITVGLPPS